MLNSHYAFAIEDLRQHEPRPADVEWMEARAALSEQRDNKQSPSAEAGHDGISSRSKVRVWFSRRRRSGRS